MKFLVNAHRAINCVVSQCTVFGNIVFVIEQTAAGSVSTYDIRFALNCLEFIPKNPYFIFKIP